MSVRIDICPRHSTDHSGSSAFVRWANPSPVVEGLDGVEESGEEAIEDRHFLRGRRRAAEPANDRDELMLRVDPGVIPPEAICGETRRGGARPECLIRVEPPE